MKKLLDTLTLEEKVGQLVQIAPFFYIKDLDKEIFGPLLDLGIKESDIFLTGSVLGIGNATEMKMVQDKYLSRSRHKIPLMFMADIIHGYKTIFPVPLAMACSFNPKLIEKAARISAVEAQTSGIHVTFSPMADLTRDPRWGRVVEGFGEDPYLNGLYSASMVKGYQNDDISLKGSLASCVKHFAGYGLSEAGRDYNTVDVSRLNLHQYYMSGYKKALDAGAKLVMTSFNIIEGIPATTNKYLLRDLLKNQWGFDGVVISDYDSLKETIAHGTSFDEADATRKAVEAGLDIEMATALYMIHIEKLLKNNKLTTDLIDDSVLRVLNLKKELGLFENPYKGASEADSKRLVLSKEHKKASLELASESIVMLKNNNILPLKNSASIALLGNYAKSRETIGPWSWHGNPSDNNSLEETLNNYTTNIYSNDSLSIESLDINEVMSKEVIVLAVGEHARMSGEAHSRSDIKLPVDQVTFIQEVAKLGKKIILVLYNGRPLDLTNVVDHVDAILETFFLGTMASDAIANTIFGFNNPSGKLTMSFPRNVGQVPVYYNYLNTGRPHLKDGNAYTSFYLDVENEPLFSFGFGLSYSTFIIDNLKLDKNEFYKTETIQLTVDIENTSKRDGYEVIQLYIRDITAEVSRPLKELKDFKKIFVKANTKTSVSFEIGIEALSYVHSDLSYGADEGYFEVFVGNSSDAVIKAAFKLVEESNK